MVDMFLPTDCSINVAYKLGGMLGRDLKIISGWHGQFPLRHYGAVIKVLREFFPHVDEDTAAPVPLLVEYIGQVRSHSVRQTFGHSFANNKMCPACRGKGQYAGLYMTCRTCNVTGVDPIASQPERYASAWVDGDWTVRFPEQVLCDFFPVVEKFDGDFYKALLSAPDMSKAYKQYARQFHPDVNPRGGPQFLKLKEAYDTLLDPVRRKRYEAGLRFQNQTPAAEVTFRVPKSCGGVTVDFDMESRGNLQIVSKIHAWEDIYNEQGQVMCSTWNPKESNTYGKLERGMKPFTITWEDVVPEFDIQI